MVFAENAQNHQLYFSYFYRDLEEFFGESDAIPFEFC